MLTFITFRLSEERKIFILQAIISPWRVSEEWSCLKKEQYSDRGDDSDEVLQKDFILINIEVSRKYEGGISVRSRSKID